MTKVASLKKSLTVLLIEDSPDYAALVEQWLSLRTDSSFVLNWADSLQAGLNRLKNGGIDVVLLDLGLPDSNGMETFNRTKLQGYEVPIILLSGDNSEQLALQMVQEGAEDYIVKGTCNGDSLTKAIQYAVVRTNSRSEKAGSDAPVDQAPLVGVMGVKGGVGCTTIACNLAAELRRQTRKKTLLADLDLNGGTVGFLMGGESDYSVLDAAGNTGRLDLSFWEGLVSHGSGDLDVLRSPSQPGVAEPDPGSMQHVLAMARKLYSWVVLDAGRPGAFSLGAIDKVTQLLLVTTTGIPALYEAKRTIDVLRKKGFEGDRLKVIVNQLSRSEEFSRSELDRLFGAPVYARFPASGKELHDACVKNTLPGKNTEFGLQMAGLAGKMA